MGLITFNPRPTYRIFNTHLLADGTVSASVALCESRHDIPGAVDGAIFPQTIDPTDVDAAENHAIRVIMCSHVTDLTVYVTGLTMALVATMNACHILGVTLHLMHYNTATGSYFPHDVL